MEINPKKDHAHYGEVVYNDLGQPVCHICGAAFDKLMSHVNQVHGITARDYKLTYGLDVRKGIVSGKTRDKLQKAFQENYDTAVNNLLEHGSKYRFKEGDREDVSQRISEQHRRRISDINKAMGSVKIHRSTIKRIINKK